MKLKLLNDGFLTSYKTQISFNLDDAFKKKLDDLESTEDTENFKFYLASAAVHSSNIEGNTVSFDTYLKATEYKLHLKTKEIREI